MAETDVKGLATALREELATFHSPANLYIEGEARKRWEKANPGKDWLEDGPDIDWELESYVILARRALAALSGTREAGEPTHRHKKRGSEYRLIGVGKMQAEWWYEGKINCNPSVDMREVSIYRSVDDGSLWVRPREEFEDGRFEEIAAAPPAEVERGAVTDETVRLACPQCDFGIGLHEPECGQLPAALASPTPAPQPAVEAQGVERFRFNEGDWNNLNEMVPASDGEWVRYDALASEKARADRLEAAFADASRQLDDTVALMQAAKADYFTAEAELAKLREAGEYILPYLRYTIGEESPGYHPTMPSAVAAFNAALHPTTSDGGTAG